jgi:hypothetical protein
MFYNEQKVHFQFSSFIMQIIFHIHLFVRKLFIHVRTNTVEQLEELKTNFNSNNLHNDYISYTMILNDIINKKS